MIILPRPREITYGSMGFQLDSKTVIALDAKCNYQDFESAVLLQKDMQCHTCFKPAILKTAAPRQSNKIFLIIKDEIACSYQLDVHAGGIDIIASGSTGLFYGVQTLRQIIASEGLKIPEVHIKDTPVFEYRGFMHDVTRGKVPKLATLKELADRASYYKLNQLQLYIEHTFAFQDMSEVWRGTGPITAEEILELDEYCKRRHIELVPTFATFGHLYEMLRSKSYRHLCELQIDDNDSYTWPDRQLHHTLDVSNEESIELVRRMIDEFIPLFSSNKVNISCDETFDLGEEKNRELAAKVGKGRLYMDFLLKIISHVQYHGKTVMFWDDILLEHPDYLKEIPQNVICLTWQYAAQVREEKIQIIQSTGLQQYVCPGVSAWNRLAADMDTSTSNIAGSVTYAKKHSAIGILNTDWGDYGHINLLSASWPGMILGGAMAWNSSDVSGPAEMDRLISFVEYGDKDGRIVPLQRELGTLCRLNWAQLVAWHCDKFLNRRFEFPNTDGLDAVSEDDILSCCHRANEIANELAQLSSSVPQSKMQDMKELVNAARGTDLLNRILLVIKKYELKQELRNAAISLPGLAGDIELWFCDYEGLWRSRNKESELHRIQSVLFAICDYLRTL